ncbi:MAG TPA: phospho-sugar mutase [Peptococcaceae bacterium]|nr:phospho-sugar mutase [Peptococcaceae bacterium]
MTTDLKVQEKYKSWLNDDYFDPETRQELLGITDPKEIEDRFYTDLKFGTGGMRGVLGAGTNRMNKYIIRKLTKGLADAINEYGEDARKRGAVIAYDSRRYSREFALETALVLAANGIKTYLFEGLRPTPELSFAVRFLRTKAGVNITASHNPKDYNGYKVYWEDGGQIPPQQAEKIVAKLAALPGWAVETLSREEAIDKGLLTYVGEDVDQAYYAQIKKQLLFPQLDQEKGNTLKIVFTPLHGTGGEPVRRVLQETGFTSLWTVPEQEKPDAEFSTVKSPNPEDPEAFELALKLGKEKGAHIILATDPDADRLGLYAQDQKGVYHRFTGNQIGVLLAYYLFSQQKKLGKLPQDAVMVKTVASTDLGDKIAESFGVRTVNVLVGFKYIGEQIKDMENKGWGTFLFGFEESHGYLAGTYARDKDAVLAAALLSEAALYYLVEEKKTLPEVLTEIFNRYGYYKDEQVAITLKGKEGQEKIAAVMDFLRKEKRSCIAGLPLEKIEDFQAGQRLFVPSGKVEDINLPRENVMKFSFQGGGFVMARPSGTEPKIRFYFCIQGDSPEQLVTTMGQIKEEFFGGIRDLLQ